MTSEQHRPAQVADLDSLADAISAALVDHPGVVRLEPTVRSLIDRWTPEAFDQIHRSLRPAGSPPVVARDGLILTLADGVLDLKIDVATDISRSALDLAREAQEVAARLIRAEGIAVGRVDVSILAIEGTAVI
ncbi:hypothetical protein [Arthrobacter sp. Ld5]|uniref:hypothetical protein n=1 Tax=Arthrobacter sp. Ld5 TaxID=649152 RepID=UPI003EC0A032